MTPAISVVVFCIGLYRPVCGISHHSIIRHFYRASSCNARTARYYFTNSVRLSVCPMPVMCQNKWTYCHMFLTAWLGHHSSFYRNKNLCGRDGRTICGPLCVPKSTYVTLAHKRKQKFFYFGCSLVRRFYCKINKNNNGTDGQTDRETDRQTDGQSATQYAAPS